MAKINWDALVKQVCNHAGIDCEQIETITTWEQTFTHNDLFRNNAVFRIGDGRILKLYGRDFKRRYYVEVSVLKTLSENDAVPTPQFITAGELPDGQPYLVMGEIAGEPLQDFWEIRDELSEAELLKLAREIGQLTLALHQSPTDDLAQVEKLVGGRHEMIAFERDNRLKEIDNMNHLTKRQRDDLRDFLLGDAYHFHDVPPVLTHSDFSWAHVYIRRQDDDIDVTGFIDWAEAMLGPPEWDISFHWLWTFSQHKDTMREFLKTYYPDGNFPSQFARRCLGTHMYTFSMEEAWDYFQKDVDPDADIIHEVVTTLFPPDVFGSPD